MWRERPIDILTRIRSGDESAFALLLGEEWGRLVRYLGRRVDSLDAAQDAAQEAFVRLWEKRETWREGSARALLFRLAENVAMDMHRKAAVHRRWSARSGSPPPASPPTPVEELEGGEASSRFLAALEALPAKRRKVFELVRHEGLSYREVAEVLSLSPQTVANHMSLALHDLRVSMAEFLSTATGGIDPPEQARSEDG